MVLMATTRPPSLEADAAQWMRGMLHGFGDASSPRSDTTAFLLDVVRTRVLAVVEEACSRSGCQLLNESALINCLRDRPLALEALMRNGHISEAARDADKVDSRAELEEEEEGGDHRSLRKAYEEVLKRRGIAGLRGSLIPENTARLRRLERFSRAMTPDDYRRYAEMRHQTGSRLARQRNFSAWLLGDSEAPTGPQKRQRGASEASEASPRARKRTRGQQDVEIREIVGRREEATALEEQEEEEEEEEEEEDSREAARHEDKEAQVAEKQEDKNREAAEVAPKTSEVSLREALVHLQIEASKALEEGQLVSQASVDLDLLSPDITPTGTNDDRPLVSRRKSLVGFEKWQELNTPDVKPVVVEDEIGQQAQDNLEKCEVFVEVKKEQVEEGREKNDEEERQVGGGEVEESEVLQEGSVHGDNTTADGEEEEQDEREEEEEDVEGDGGGEDKEDDEDETFDGNDGSREEDDGDVGDSGDDDWDKEEERDENEKNKKMGEDEEEEAEEDENDSEDEDEEDQDSGSTSPFDSSIQKSKSKNIEEEEEQEIVTADKRDEEIAIEKEKEKDEEKKKAKEKEKKRNKEDEEEEGSSIAQRIRRRSSQRRSSALEALRKARSERASSASSVTPQKPAASSTPARTASASSRTTASPSVPLHNPPIGETATSARSTASTSQSASALRVSNSVNRMLYVLSCDFVGRVVDEVFARRKATWPTKAVEDLTLFHSHIQKHELEAAVKAVEFLGPKEPPTPPPPPPPQPSTVSPTSPDRRREFLERQKHLLASLEQEETGEGGISMSETVLAKVIELLPEAGECVEELSEREGPALRPLLAQALVAVPSNQRRLVLLRSLRLVAQDETNEKGAATKILNTLNGLKDKASRLKLVDALSSMLQMKQDRLQKQQKAGQPQASLTT